MICMEQLFAHVFAGWDLYDTVRPLHNTLQRRTHNLNNLDDLSMLIYCCGLSDFVQPLHLYGNTSVDTYINDI